MQQNIEFERCIDFLVRMIDKYGEEVLWELEEDRFTGGIAYRFLAGNYPIYNIRKPESPDL